MKNLWFLAETDAPDVVGESMTETQTSTQDAAGDPNTTTQGPPRNPLMQYLPIILLVVAVYFIIFRAPKKRQQKHSTMVQSLKKNDKVRTIGGVIGTVIDIDGDEITLKIDEANNTKMKVVSSAIGQKISQD